MSQEERLPHPSLGMGRGAGDRVALDPGDTASHGWKGRGCLAMGKLFRVAGAASAGAPDLPGPGVQPTQGPPSSRAAGVPEPAPGLTDDHDRIAGGLDDVLRQLFSAGLALETALGLIGEHRAADSIQHAVSELDQAITGIRGMAI